jgi:pimeloyl-ACP methyl ester carboxylesterase
MHKLFTSFIASLCALSVPVVNLVADEIGIRKIEVPIVDNRVSLKTIAQEMLEVKGSDVILPADVPDQTLHIHPATLPLGLLIWNRILNPFGGEVFYRGGKVFVEVDLKDLDTKLDKMEADWLSAFGVERNAVLHHLSEPGSTGPAVVLVHGLDSGKRLFRGVCRILVQKGYDVYFFEYPNDDRVERNAFRLSEALKALPSERRKDLTLITVSMGGVISQWMLEHPELTVEGVTRFIACVPPFQGSEMAALRGFVEIGDHAMDVVFDPKDALDVWGDGMGRAGIDLQPDSLVMEKLDTLERNPNVAYSILAGNVGMFDSKPLREFRDKLADEETVNAVRETARILARERLDVMLKFQTPQGDGAVALESATLEGVSDRVVLPYNHLQFLTGFSEDEEKIAALDEVLKRLPDVE